MEGLAAVICRPDAASPTIYNAKAAEIYSSKVSVTGCKWKYEITILKKCHSDISYEQFILH